VLVPSPARICLPAVSEHTSQRCVTEKHDRALPGPVGRPVQPPSTLVRPWAQKKTDSHQRSVLSYVQDGQTGRFGTLPVLPEVA